MVENITEVTVFRGLMRPSLQNQSSSNPQRRRAAKLSFRAGGVCGVCVAISNIQGQIMQIKICVGVFYGNACVCCSEFVCVCVLGGAGFPLSPSSSQSCLYLSVMVVPCCLHSASRGSAMNCSVISVNILAPLESRIFSISLTCRRTEEETGRTVT